MRKPRSDSALLNLPEDRQDQIVAWAREPKGDKCTGGIQHAREQLAADGIKVSDSQLSRFLAWWSLDRRYKGFKRTAEQLREMAAAKGVPVEKAAELAQGMFTLQSIEANDTETFIALQRLDLDTRSAETKARQKEADIKLSERRVALLEKKAAQADATDKVLANAELTPEQRAQRIAEIYGRA